MSTTLEDRSLTRGYLIALLSAAILSTTAIFIRYLTVNTQIPALVLAFWRAACVVLTMVLILGIARPGLLRPGRQQVVYLFAYGFVLAMFNALWTLSVAFNGAAVATVLVYCSAAFTALLGWWLLKERLDWAKLSAVVVCLAGCALVAGVLQPGAWGAASAGTRGWLGIVTGITSGLGYAAYSLMGRSAAQRGLSPWTTLTYTFGFAALFLLLANLLPGTAVAGTAAEPADMFWLGMSWSDWGLILLLAAGPTVAGFGLYNVSLSLLPSSVANLVLTTEPVFTAAMAYLLLGERLSAQQLAGSLLILAGVLFLRIYEGWLVRQARRQREVDQQMIRL